MSRITIIDQENASAEQRRQLEGIGARFGTVPNYLRILANSPVALKAFLGLNALANEGSLSLQTRERIALALAQRNSCEYSLAAHMAAGRGAGLTGNEMAANREGTSEDARAALAVRLALSLAQNKGEIDNTELVAARVAGYTDADIVEIIGHVGMNLLAIILAKASQVGLDPPSVAPRRAKAVDPLPPTPKVQP